MSRFHAWTQGDPVFDGELGRVTKVAKTRWGTPSATVTFPSGERMLTPPRAGHRASVLDREVIAAFVAAFYAKAANDALLGPVFASRIEDWPHHIERLTAFWASVLLDEQSFHGRPGPLHRALETLTPQHFDRWLALFETTLGEVCEGPVIGAVLERAGAMRRGLSRIVFGDTACS